MYIGKIMFTKIVDYDKKEKKLQHFFNKNIENDLSK